MTGETAMDRFSYQRSKLAREVRRYSGKTHARTKSVAIYNEHPVFSDFTPPQLDYYLYWRSTVGTPEFEKASDGYCWLYVCELINSDDREKASEQLNFLATATDSRGKPYYPQLAKTAVEYSEFNGTPMPGYRKWMCDDENLRMTSRILAHPVSDMSEYILYGKVDRLVYYDLPSDLVETVGSVLRAIDEYIISATDKTLRDLIGQRVSERFEPFKEYVYLGTIPPMERICWEFGCDINDILGIILWDWYSIDCFDSDCHYDGLWSSLIGEIDEIWPTESVSPFSKSDGVVVRRLGERGAYGPVCMPYRDSGMPGTFTMADIAEYASMEPASKAQFVFSGKNNPSYSELNPGQLAYYLTWRDEFFKGNCMDLDEGYLHLFATELINSVDVQKTQKSLFAVTQAYFESLPDWWEELVTDYALVNGIAFDNVAVSRNEWVMNNWVESFLKGTNSIPLTDG